jgi:saccharopine dehydrogenase (NAD+, L-lysine-forming)
MKTTKLAERTGKFAAAYGGPSGTKLQGAGMQQVVVVGAAGLQAGSLLDAIFRVVPPSDVAAVDVAWPSDRANALTSCGVNVVIIDGSEGALAAAVRDSKVVVNLAGPYHLLGTRVLDAAIREGANYLDICDDADVTAQILSRDQRAAAAGITAITGLGSSPGTTNVLARVAVDFLGFPDETTVDISWIVDHADLSRSVVEHLLHCFATARAGQASATPSWEELDPRWVSFPEPVGRQRVVLLGHPEPLTLTRALGVKAATNRGGIAPAEYTHLCWLLARGREQTPPNGQAALWDVFDQFAAALRQPSTRCGSGLVIDVQCRGRRVIFRSGSTMTMDHATGLPCAAGTLLLLNKTFSKPGVFSPESLDPRSFFEALRSVSDGGGGLQATLEMAGEEPTPIRIRDLLANAATR